MNILPEKEIKCGDSVHIIVSRKYVKVQWPASFLFHVQIYTNWESSRIRDSFATFARLLLCKYYEMTFD